MKAVQLGLFTGQPTKAEWLLDKNGRWWCVRCLKVLPKGGPKPRRMCPCGWKRAVALD